MAIELYNADLATTTVASGGTTAPAGGTSETWTVALSAMFGSAATGISQFHVADAASGKGSEIIAVTNVSGTTWTVTRGAESTTPVTHQAGFTIYQVVTAGGIGAFPQWYNVRSPVYGAAGNGSADDTTAIQAALSALPSGGGTVYLPEGTYKVSSALTVPARAVLQGAGVNASVINQSSTSAACLTATDKSFITVRDLKINGPGSGTGRGIAFLHSSQPVQGINLENLAVTNFGGDGVHLETPITSVLTNVLSQSNGGHGFFANNGTSVSFRSCFGNANTGNGYELDAMSYSQLASCAADGDAIGYSVNACSSVVLSGCGAETLPVGFKILNGSVSITLQGCRVFAETSTGFWVTGASTQITLAGCNEVSPNGATASAQVDTASSSAMVISPNFATATSYAAGSVTSPLGLDTSQRIISPVGSFLVPSPSPVSRRPAFRPASYAQIFQSGHGWTATGSGVGSSNLNDTSTFIKGTQCATVVTAGNGAQANLRSTAVPSQDLTGKAIRLTFQIANVTHLNNILFYVGSSAFSNFFNWTVHTHSGSSQNYVQSGEWVTLTIPWANVQTASGSYSISANGVPSTLSGFTNMQFAVFDDAAGTVTAHLQAVEVIPDTVTTFPNGVVSVVFDDTYQNVYDNARPVMDPYGYRGTLYTIASSVGAFGALTLPEMQNLQAISGWEVAGHAYTLAAHNAGYDTLTALQVDDEMRYLRSWMLSNGFPIDNFAYPQGHFSATTDNVPIDGICAQYFSTGRSIISETAETFPASMPFRVRAKTGISSSGTNVSVITAAGGALDRCQLDGSWYIMTFHQVVTSGVTDSTMITTADFTTLMAAVNSRGIPVLPVGDVIRNYT